MRSRSMPIFLAVLAPLLAACDLLQTRPGGDFAVVLLTPSPLVAVGRIAVPVEARVAGCDAFEVAVRAAGASHPLDVLQLGGGTFAAEVPVEWLRGADGRCDRDASTPAELAAQLVVTCLEASRTAAADLTVRYAAAARVVDFGSVPQPAVIQHIFPASDPFAPLVIAPQASPGYVSIEPGGGRGGYEPTPYRWLPLVEPRAVAGPAMSFFTFGCSPGEICQDVAVSADVRLPGSLLRGLRWDGNSLRDSWAFVPAGVVDMAFAEDGALVVLSQAGDSPLHRETAAVVTRVAPAPVNYSHDAAVVGYFPGERLETRFSRTPAGRLAFATSAANGTQSSDVRILLRSTDGTTVDARFDATAENGWQRNAEWLYHRSAIQLSPDASLFTADGAYLGPSGGRFLRLPSADNHFYVRPAAGAVWPTGAVVLWEGLGLGEAGSSDAGRLEAFDLVPPHSRRFGYAVHGLAGTSRPVALHGVAAVGGKLLLTTSTGVRVLSSDGRLLGGSDPLPCGLTPTALAVQTGPSHFAVGAGRYLYLFDLSTLDDAATATPTP